MGHGPLFLIFSNGLSTPESSPYGCVLAALGGYGLSLWNYLRQRAEAGDSS